MNRGQRRTLSLVVLTQFLGALADNALLVISIALLMERHTAAWTVPALRIVFYAASLVLAPLAGRFADAWPKGRVIFIGSLAKCIGCALLVFQLHPLMAYALVGISAAAYGPAKYGILPEFLTARDLVSGNAWMEISTVLAILIGVGASSFLLTHDVLTPLVPLGSIALHAAACLLIVYAIAALTALSIPSTRILLQRIPADAASSLQQFYRDQQRLWRDREGGIAMAVTCLFWAVAAGLQFVVLRWGQEVAQLSPGQSALLQLPVALGLVAGAAAAGRWIRLSAVLSLLPIGLMIGAALVCVANEHNLRHMVVLLTVIGVLSGLLLIPMNALLQHRGALLMHTGQSIAVQGFGENSASVLLLSTYGALVTIDAPLSAITAGFGCMVLLAVLAMMRWSRVVAVG